MKFSLKNLFENKDTPNEKLHKAITCSPSAASEFDPKMEYNELIMKPSGKKLTPEELEELKFLDYCSNILRKLGYIKTQYEFSEQFLGKSKHYTSMLMTEQREPSIDALHNLITNISDLNDGVNSSKYLDELYSKGYDLLTKRLLKYI